MASSSTDNSLMVLSGKRNFFLLSTYPALSQTVQKYQNELRSYCNREEEKQLAFAEKWQISPREYNVSGQNAVYDISQALQYWAKNFSYDFCKNCNSVLPCKMLPTFLSSKEHSAWLFVIALMNNIVMLCQLTI